MKTIKTIMLLLAAVFPLPSAIAANLLGNGGFESPGTVTTYKFLSNNDTTSVTGWTAIDDAIGERPYLMYKNRAGGNYTNRVFEGLYALAINQGSGIKTTFPVTAGVTYTLSFQVRKGTTAGYTPLEVSIAGFNTTFASVTGSFQLLTYTFTASTTNPAAELRFFNSAPTPDYKTYDIDAVVVEEGTGPTTPPNPFVGLPADAGDPAFITSHFSGSQNCAMCHNGIVDNQSKDVSIVTDWSSTMMANSSRDPFWRAKVRSEMSRHPELQTVINDKCSKCHAPMANAQAKKDGSSASQTIFDGGILDVGHAKHDAAMDGVSCTLCHQIPATPALGTLATMSGNYAINDSKTIYGPYGGPGDTALFTMPMIMHTGYTPTYGAQIKESKLCASCHNLKTPYVDQNGTILSTTPESEFPEQTPYMEWEQSSYVGQKSCQGCHMSRTDGVKISTMGMSGLRNNFAIHDLVGANKLMLDILSNNKNQLGVLSNNFAETLSKTDAMLKSAATVTVAEQRSTPNALDFTLQINSTTGHKLPTSYPSRRAVVHVVVTNAQNQIVWESGKVRADGSIVGVDADENGANFEPHYDQITADDQVQVYEAIMGNDQGEVTYTLLRGKEYLKDNRILPPGFNKTSAPADVRVAGSAASDSNFIGGSDQISYQIGGLPVGNYTVKAELVYQTLSHAYAEDLFSDTATPEVADFKTMFDASSQKSSVIASAEFAGTVAAPPAPDSDGDGVSDNLDNCKLVVNANQRNTDGDSFGNICDPDFNQNNVVDPADLSRLKSKLGTVSANEDLNGNGVVDSADLSLLKTYLGKAPGPTGIAP
ncbi:DUF642 domain-containing protein [Methylomonas sp. LW13]|uniref:dockerin type I domain-containing protein n=1 Tax=unclassified Methylomonas TaxID=2608980 RepID=UPI00068A9ADD|nr:MULTISPECIES: dockerin type I domain-containing protein [unclassified Methylomonas]PKD42325.1 hypothetical protein CWO84_00540 [Methylomonas sp. Kb3]QBC25827.1 DUF642 domain-containing protein [Methylomonas sp. LW13]